MCLSLSKTLIPFNKQDTMAALMTRMTGSPPGLSSSPSFTSPPPPPPSSLPLRTIPGSYGWPVLGPISDRLDYFWFQGPETFFKKRIEKHNSTVFRTNIPPTFPLFAGVNPNVVAVLDVRSFSHLFDMEVVEKANVLVGDFMPSTSFTGDIRVCAYLDTSEPQHTQVKSFMMDILKRSSSKWVPTMVTNMDTLWETIESDISKSGSAATLGPLQKFLFDFLCICIVGADPSSSPEVAKSGPGWLDAWLALQLLPTVSTGAPGYLQPFVEVFLHSIAYPFLLVQSGYTKLAEFVEKEGKEAIQRGKTEFNLSQKESVHNLLFTLGFNAYGGFLVFFLSLFSVLGDEKNKEIQEKLRNEVREKVGTYPSKLSFESIREMELLQSFVYETLRLNPPVPLQFARARKDFKLASHDSAFEIKKGELLCGYQALVMRDPKVFENPEKFDAQRFCKDKELLNYLFWSNGPQTGTPSQYNKQCAAKDLVTLSATLFLAHMYQRYDSITFSGANVTAVKKAS